MIQIIWITGNQATPQYRGYFGLKGDSPHNDIKSVSTQSSTTHILNMLTLITKMITLDILQKCKLHYLMFFFYFSQMIKQVRNVQNGVRALQTAMDLLLLTHVWGLVYTDATWSVLLHTLLFCHMKELLLFTTD